MRLAPDRTGPTPGPRTGLLMRGQRMAGSRMIVLRMIVLPRAAALRAELVARTAHPRRVAILTRVMKAQGRPGPANGATW